MAPSFSKMRTYVSYDEPHVSILSAPPLVASEVVHMSHVAESSWSTYHWSGAPEPHCVHSPLVSPEYVQLPASTYAEYEHASAVFRAPTGFRDSSEVEFAP